jgi:glycosyltransferase involved in cell wall biosynthesis
MSSLEAGRATVPLISVVIPCYNQALYLGEAIRSVLEQRAGDIEIVVVNDGSTDDTVAVASGFPGVRCLTQENRGLAAARNTGLSHCRGELIVFLDADDRLLPGALETGGRLIAADRSLAFVAGFSRFISGSGEPLPTRQPVRDSDHPYRGLLRRNSIRNPAMVVFRRAAVDAASGFDSTVDACADYDIYLRLSRQYPVRFHDAVVAEYRKHGANMSLDAALMLRQLCVVMQRQRGHLADSATREAHRAGIQNIRDYWGDLLATRIRSRLRFRSEWRRVLADVMTLLRWHHRGAFVHTFRKLSLWSDGLGGRREREPAEDAALTAPVPEAEAASSPPGTPSNGRRRTPMHTPAETMATPAQGTRLFAETAPGDRTGRE